MLDIFSESLADQIQKRIQAEKCIVPDTNEHRGRVITIFSVLTEVLKVF